MAELYNVENVPTAFWINEDLEFVRPGDVVFGSDYFQFLTGINSKDHKSALKKWVKEGQLEQGYSKREIKNEQTSTSRTQDDAKAYYHLAQWFYEKNQNEKAQIYFNKAIEMAPDDVAIRRGSMRMRDKNPTGVAFLKMVIERYWNGLSYYNPLSEFN